MAYHAENHGHHGKAIHGAMVVDMCDPGAVEGDETVGVDGAGENVLWDKVAFVPEKNLVAAGNVGVGVGDGGVGQRACVGPGTYVTRHEFPHGNRGGEQSHAS